MNKYIVCILTTHMMLMQGMDETKSEILFRNSEALQKAWNYALSQKNPALLNILWKRIAPLLSGNHADGAQFITMANAESAEFISRVKDAASVAIKQNDLQFLEYCLTYANKLQEYNVNAESKVLCYALAHSLAQKNNDILQSVWDNVSSVLSNRPLEYEKFLEVIENAVTKATKEQDAHAFEAAFNCINALKEFDPPLRSIILGRHNLGALKLYAKNKKSEFLQELLPEIIDSFQEDAIRLIMISHLELLPILDEYMDFSAFRFSKGKDSCLDKAIACYKLWGEDYLEILKFFLNPKYRLLTLDLVPSLVGHAAHNAHSDVFQLFYHYGTELGAFADQTITSVALEEYKKSSTIKNLKLVDDIFTKHPNRELAHDAIYYSLHTCDFDLFRCMAKRVSLEHLRFDENNFNNTITCLHIALERYDTHRHRMIPFLRALAEPKHNLLTVANAQNITPHDYLVKYFREAARKGDFESFKLFHEMHGDISQTDEKGNTLFHEVINNRTFRTGHYDIMNYIAENASALWTTTNRAGLSPRAKFRSSPELKLSTFFRAAKTGSFELFKLFHTTFFKDLSITDEDGNTCLHHAIVDEPTAGHLDIMNYIHEQNKDLMEIVNNKNVSPRQMLNSQNEIIEEYVIV